MPTLLLVRHARSTSNSAGTLAGRSPGIDLDEIGREQARHLGERLRGLPLAQVVCSPMERCRQTIETALAVAGLDVPIAVDERVSECDYGEWTMGKLNELATEPLWQTVLATPSTVVFPGGEPMIAMQERMVAAVEDWNSRLPDDAIWALVSHGDPIKSVVSHALGQSFDLFQRIVGDPCSVSIVTWQADRPPMVAAVNTVDGLLTARLGAAKAPQLGGGLGTQVDGHANQALTGQGPGAT